MDMLEEALLDVTIGQVMVAAASPFETRHRIHQRNEAILRARALGASIRTIAHKACMSAGTVQVIVAKENRVSA